MNRRGFLAGIIAAAVAPTIIRTPGLIMPIKPGLFQDAPVPPLIYVSHTDWSREIATLAEEFGPSRCQGVVLDAVGRMYFRIAGYGRA